MQLDEFCTGSEELFAGRYKVTELLGEGGMGKVYLCLDTMLAGEKIALKVLHPDLCRDEKHTKRFLREVQLTRKVTHANIVRTFDVGTYKNRFFFTMEFAEGTTLKDKIEGGKLEHGEVVRILREICRGLAAIHEADIVHRDLKPGNVIITCQGGIKITDFGVARPGLSELTGFNEVVGSVAYMPPEIWSGKNVTPATDIYALGILTYRMLTGIIPFDGDAPAEVMCKHLEAKPTPPQELTKETPLWLNNLILNMLEKDPLKRPTSARQVIERIDGKLKRKGAPDDSLSLPSPEPAILGGGSTNPTTDSAAPNSNANADEDHRSIAIMTKGALIASEAETKPIKRTSSRVNMAVVRQRAILRQGSVEDDLPDGSTGATRMTRPVGLLWSLALNSLGLFFLFAVARFFLEYGTHRLWTSLSTESGTIGYILSLTVGTFLYSCFCSIPIAAVCAGVTSPRANIRAWGITSLRVFAVALIMCTFYIAQLEFKRKERSLEFDKERLPKAVEAALNNLVQATLLSPYGKHFGVSSDLDPLEIMELNPQEVGNKLPYYAFLASYLVVAIYSICVTAAWSKAVKWRRIAAVFVIILGTLHVASFLLKPALQSWLALDPYKMHELKLGTLTILTGQYTIWTAIACWIALFLLTSILIPLIAKRTK